MLSLVLLNKTRKYNYQRLTSFLKIDSFLAEQTASPLSVLSFMLTSFFDINIFIHEQSNEKLSLNSGVFSDLAIAFADKIC